MFDFGTYNILNKHSPQILVCDNQNVSLALSSILMVMGEMILHSPTYYCTCGAFTVGQYMLWWRSCSLGMNGEVAKLPLDVDWSQRSMDWSQGSSRWLAGIMRWEGRGHKETQSCGTSHRWCMLTCLWHCLPSILKGQNVACWQFMPQLIIKTACISKQTFY